MAEAKAGTLLQRDLVEVCRSNEAGQEGDDPLGPEDPGRLDSRHGGNGERGLPFRGKAPILEALGQLAVEAGMKVACAQEPCHDQQRIPGTVACFVDFAGTRRPG